jgi:hypothetical protein
MPGPWQILRAAGLPLAIATDAPRPDAAALAAAVGAARAEQPTGRDADALAALVLGWRKHWPAAFAQAFADADALEAWALAQLADDDRLLKLRRLAVAGLAEVL